ncbi:MAG: histidine phosphatase family protein [Cyanobacteria bacterium P01_H01_bin.15]
MTTRVIIVRHGQSTYNLEQRIQGRCDESTLTPKGQADAVTVGKALKSLNIAAFYCSPLQRASQTARIICDRLDAEIEPQPLEKLREIDLPLWEKLTKTEVKSRFGAEYRQWKSNPDQFKMTLPDGREHFPVISLFQQARQFWQEILPRHQNQTILVVAHNGINRCLISTSLGMGPERYQSIQQSNCGINILNFSGQLDDLVQLESLNQTAHLGVSTPSLRPGHQGVRLLLVRHGETQWNKESRFQGIKDIPLNENGRAQARQARDFLTNVPIDFAISSSLSRPKETAEIILEGHSQVTLDTDYELREISHGLWEGMLESEIEANFPGMLAEWKAQPETVQMPEGENLQEVWNRANKAWERIVQAHGRSLQTGLVVAHDAINKVILCRLLGLPPAAIWSVKQGNGAVTVIDYPQGPDSLPVIQAFNITSHLGGVLDKTAAGAL